MKLEDVVPWGRPEAEYRLMFALTDADRSRQILDCAAGPASFNAEATAAGWNIVSCDPLYRFGAAEIAARFDATYDVMLRSVREQAASFVWTQMGTPQRLGRVRMGAMQRFLGDFPAGLRQGRYVPAGLPQLPFKDRSFDLALCSHFLFTYSTQFDAAFHLASIVELCRVAGEVRVFPLLASTVHTGQQPGAPSPHLHPVLEALRRRGYDSRVERVAYEFQRGGNQMLRVVPSKRWPKPARRTRLHSTPAAKEELKCQDR